MNIGDVISRHELSKEDALPGYRFWRVDVKSGLATLESQYAMSVTWPKHEAMRAVCLCARNVIVSHTCGIYATMYPRPMPSSSKIVYGEVHLWGEVFVHEFGLRGMFAEPVCLWKQDAEESVDRLRLELVAEQYSLPIVRQPEASETYWVQQDWRRLREMSLVKR